MFITNQRIAEIRAMIEKGDYEALKGIDTEEMEAYFRVDFGQESEDEDDRLTCHLYRTGVFTEEDDQYILW